MDKSLTMTTFFKELFDTETIIPIAEYIDMHEYLETIGEFNKEQCEISDDPIVLHVFPKHSDFFPIIVFNDNYKKLDWKQFIQLTNRFQHLFGHSWSDMEFKAYMKNNYF